MRLDGLRHKVLIADISIKHNSCLLTLLYSSFLNSDAEINFYFVFKPLILFTLNKIKHLQKPTMERTIIIAW